MGLASKGRSGRGSTKPANVKLRPNLPPEERAQPRRKADADSFAVIPRQELSDNDGESDGDDMDDGLVKFENEKKPLQGMQVCTTGKLEVSREDVRRICHTLGARFEPALATNTTFLVSDKTEGDKYRAAVDNGIPVLHSAFLQDLHSKWVNASADIDIRRLSEHYRLAPLHGLTICLTGYDNARSDLREKISSLGGAAYSPSLNHEATHLVVGPIYSSSFNNSGEGPILSDNGKVQAAQKINARRRATTNGIQQVPPIQIVWGEWLEHSLLAFGRLNEANYSCELIQDRRKVLEIKGTDLKRTMDIVQRAGESPSKESSNNSERGQGGKRKRSAAVGGVKLLREDTSVILGQARDAAAASRKKVKVSEEEEEDISTELLAQAAKSDSSDINRVKRSRNATLDDGTDQEEAEMARIVGKGKERANIDAAQASAAAGARPVIKKQRLTAHAELLGVQDLLAPLPSAIFASTSSSTSDKKASQKPQVFVEVSSISESQSTRNDKTSSDVKGKGKAKQSSESTAARVKMESQQAILPSSAATLRASGTADAKEVAHQVSLIKSSSSSSLLSNLGKSRTSKFSAGTSGTTSTSAASAENSTKKPEIARAKLESQQQIALPPSAVQQQPDLLDHQQAVDPMSQDNLSPPPIFEGKTFLLRFPGVKKQVVEGIEETLQAHGATIAHREGPEVDYLVYRFAQTGKEKIDTLDERVVSDVWLEACIYHEKIMEPEDDELVDVMKKPLQFDLPLPNTERLQISYSGFDECSLALCIKFCNALSLKHDKRIIKNQTTHLVIPNGEYTSTRLGAAQDWGVKVVYPEWLRGLAKQRTQQDGKKSVFQDDMDVVEMEKPVIEGPLAGCRIAIHRDLETPRLRDLISQLGATYSHSIDPSSKSTHFIYQSRRLKDSNKDFKLALELGKFIVHPKWLEACLKTGIKLPEQAWKWTLDASRSLEIGLESQAANGTQSRKTAGSASVQPENRYEEDENDEFPLPPPLSKSSRIASASIQKPPMTGIAQSTPRTQLRTPQFPSSPPRENTNGNSLHRSSSATLCSPPSTSLHSPGKADLPNGSNAKLRPALSAPNLGKDNRGGADSGFVPSATAKSSQGALNPSSSTTSSSPRSADLKGSSWQDNDITLNNGSSDPDPTPVAFAHEKSRAPTSTAITRDLLAEMNAIMDAEMPEHHHLNARLPYQQLQQQGSNNIGADGSGNGSANRIFRRMPMKKPDTSFPSSDSLKAVSRPAAHVEPRYEGLFESQFGGNRHHNHIGAGGVETQTQLGSHTAAEESMMVIRISDPTAEATKARMLAGIRKLTSAANTTTANAEEQEREAEDEEETQKSSESASRRSSRKMKA